MMDVSQIPKSFWHALSVCIIILTIAFVLIAWRSTSLTIEIANSKINLSQATTQAENVNKELQQMAAELEREREQLNETRRQLAEAAARAESRNDRHEVVIPRESMARFEETLRPRENLEKMRSEQFDQIQSQLERAQMSIQQIQR